MVDIQVLTVQFSYFCACLKCFRTEQGRAKMLKKKQKTKTKKKHGMENNWSKIKVLQRPCFFHKETLTLDFTVETQ